MLSPYMKWGRVLEQQVRVDQWPRKSVWGTGKVNEGK